MMRSLYSGITGLRNHQTRMDVIGNNIANVNTIGYKSSRVIFQDIFCQTLQTGSTNQSVNFGLGGTNPIQVGLGARLASIDVLHTPAPMQRTDRALDMMINDDGYFVVGIPNPAHPDPFGLDDAIDPDDTIPRFTYMYTRAGDFKLDNEGYLVSSHGYYVMGYEMSPYDQDGAPITDMDAHTGKVFYRSDWDIWWDDNKDLEPEDREPMPNPMAIKIESDQVGFAVNIDGIVSIIQDNRELPIFQLTLAMFSNPEGLLKAGNSLYRESSSSGASNLTIAKNYGAGTVSSGGLEMSNVDLASEFTDMIVTQRGFQANSRIITVSDTMLEELVNLKR